MDSLLKSRLPPAGLKIRKKTPKGEMTMDDIVRLVDILMSQGLNGEAACQEAYTLTHQNEDEDEYYIYG